MSEIIKPLYKPVSLLSTPSPFYLPSLVEISFTRPSVFSNSILREEEKGGGGEKQKRRNRVSPFSYSPTPHNISPLNSWWEKLERGKKKKKKKSKHAALLPFDPCKVDRRTLAKTPRMNENWSFVYYIYFLAGPPQFFSRFSTFTILPVWRNDSFSRLRDLRYARSIIQERNKGFVMKLQADMRNLTSLSSFRAVNLNLTRSESCETGGSNRSFYRAINSNNKEERRKNCENRIHSRFSSPRCWKNTLSKMKIPGIESIECPFVER